MGIVSPEFLGFLVSSFLDESDKRIAVVAYLIEEGEDRCVSRDEHRGQFARSGRIAKAA